MSRRVPEAAPALSLDSFLDIVSNVVGVLVLVALVTVLGAGEIAVSGPAVKTASPGTARRVLFECRGDRLLVVDEEGNGRRVAEVVAGRSLPTPLSADVLAPQQLGQVVGDASHRVEAEVLPGGLAWVYTARDGAPGEGPDALGRPDSRFREVLRGLEPGGFAYFVVHDDGFEVFRRAREVVAAEGIAVGWHPIEGDAPIRLSAVGSLGRRVQ